MGNRASYEYAWCPVEKFLPTRYALLSRSIVGSLLCYCGRQRQSSYKLRQVLRITTEHPGYFRTAGLEFTQRTRERRLELTRFPTEFGRSIQRLSHLEHHQNQDSPNFRSVFPIIVEASNYHPPPQSVST